jgi:hypothetical protein
MAAKKKPTEEQLRQRRARNYRERVWRDHAITTGKYKGDKVPRAVMLAMREAWATHLRGDLTGFDPSARSGNRWPPSPTRASTRMGSRNGASIAAALSRATAIGMGASRRGHRPTRGSMGRQQRPPLWAERAEGDRR